MRRTVLFSWLIVLAVTAGGAGWAAQCMAVRPHAQVPGTSTDLAGLPPAEEFPLAKGRIVALDPADGRLTVSHRGVERFYIEPGTSVFRVEDPSLLVGLAPGDKIRFDVARDGRHYAVTRIENTN
jgi:Cu/Ag efflux protein CusF